MTRERSVVSTGADLTAVVQRSNNSVRQQRKNNVSSSRFHSIVYFIYMVCIVYVPFALEKR